ncbi:MAG: hypothetical protein ABI282_07145 [Candidatus Baltobacteraceae bacterium]
MNRLIAGIAFSFALTGATAFADAPSAMPSATPPAPSPSSAPTAKPNAEVMSRAKDWYHRLETGSIDRAQLDAKMNALLTDALVKSMSAQIAPLGDPVAFEQLQTGTQSGSTYYVYAVKFASGDKLDYVFAFDPATKKISGLRLLPAQ